MSVFTRFRRSTNEITTFSISCVRWPTTRCSRRSSSATPMSLIIPISVCTSFLTPL
jgi:hypothetical protein